MSKDMEEYIRNLSAEYITLNLDKVTYEKYIEEIKKIIKSRSTLDNKINKINVLIKELEDATR